MRAQHQCPALQRRSAAQPWPACHKRSAQAARFNATRPVGQGGMLGGSLSTISSTGRVSSGSSCCCKWARCLRLYNREKGGIGAAAQQGGGGRREEEEQGDQEMSANFAPEAADSSTPQPQLQPQQQQAADSWTQQQQQQQDHQTLESPPQQQQEHPEGSSSSSSSSQKAAAPPAAAAAAVLEYVAIELDDDGNEVLRALRRVSSMREDVPRMLRRVSTTAREELPRLIRTVSRMDRLMAPVDGALRRVLRIHPLALEAATMDVLSSASDDSGNGGGGIGGGKSGQQPQSFSLAPLDPALAREHPWLRDMREYEFTKKQEAVFRLLEQAMAKCSRVMLLLAATDALSGVIAYQSTGDRLDIFSAAADAFHQAICGLMVRYGSTSFRAVYDTAGCDIRNSLLGLMGLRQVLLELALLSGWLAVVQVATASAVWPVSIALCAALSVAMTIGRVITLGRPGVGVAFGAFVLQTTEVVRNYIDSFFKVVAAAREVVSPKAHERRMEHAARTSDLLDQDYHQHQQRQRPPSSSITTPSPSFTSAPLPPEGGAPSSSTPSPSSASAPLRSGGSSAKGPNPNATRRQQQRLRQQQQQQRISRRRKRGRMWGSGRQTQYEFSHDQEQVFRGLLASMRMCSLAKWAQGVSEALLMSAHLSTGDWASATGGLFDCMDALAVAGLLTLSIDRFDRIITTSGSDISLLLEGLGPRHGLAKFFTEMADVALFLGLAQIGQGVFAVLYTTYSLGSTLPGSLEAWCTSVGLLLGVLQQLL